MYFIDLFAGCGGLSLGLVKAGFQGFFAIEKSPDAFLTLKHNLIEKTVVSPYSWPEWLPCKAMTTGELLTCYAENLKALRGKIDLIAGGPPCQGFSFAGRRRPDDPRNELTKEYVKIVKLVQPRFLILENVKGFNSAFKKCGSENGKVYAQIVRDELEKIGYTVFHDTCKASDFGVPQPRNRFIMIASRDACKGNPSPFDLLKEFLPYYRSSKKLDHNTTVRQAISDLEIKRNKLVASTDTAGFQQIFYKRKSLTQYQSLMRDGCNASMLPNSLRLARHREETVARFKNILDHYPKGRSLAKQSLEYLGTKKQCFTPLHPNMLSRTVTTLPDDLLHYSEPRILTVRENARIQSFPDWFEFMGKYTTGGKQRQEECPRYTQVGNAVPPLMAEALGIIMLQLRTMQEAPDGENQAA
jgi:DNA (cytosine-5)-methyltransferase 1